MTSEEVKPPEPTEEQVVLFSRYCNILYGLLDAAADIQVMSRAMIVVGFGIEAAAAYAGDPDETARLLLDLLDGEEAVLRSRGLAMEGHINLQLYRGL